MTDKLLCIGGPVAGLYYDDNPIGRLEVLERGVIPLRLIGPASSNSGTIIKTHRYRREILATPNEQFRVWLYESLSPEQMLKTLLSTYTAYKKEHGHG